MERFSEECLEVFLREQSQLFDEPVAETPEEAEAFQMCIRDRSTFRSLQEKRQILSLVQCTMRPSPTRRCV